MMTKKRPVRSQMARDALKIIETYNGLPFAQRWLEEKMGSAKAKFGLKEREVQILSLLAKRYSNPEIAEALANDLYRLSIEFGVSFNEFKARVQQEVLDHSRLHESDHDFAKTPILVPARANLSIVVFALDLMRDDAEFEAE